MHPTDHLLMVGRAEIPTTALGEQCFAGGPAAEAALAGVDWTEEGTHPLHGAVYGGHVGLVRLLIQAGSPLDDTAYAIALDHHPEVVDALPPHPHLVARLRQERRLPALAHAVLHDQIEDVQRLLAEGPVTINEPIELIPSYGPMCLMQYAALRANPTVVAALLQAGADPHPLTRQGWSPLRLVLAQRMVDRDRRLACARLLRRAGATILPPLRIGERITLWLGLPLEQMHNSAL